MHRTVSLSSPTRPHPTQAPKRRTAQLLAIAALGTLLALLVGCSDGDANAEGAEGAEGAKGAKTAEAAQSGAASGDPALAAIDTFIAKNPVKRENKSWRTRVPKPPKVEFDPKRTYYWKLETNVGVIKFRLLTDVAPMHASSTIYLTRLGFYDTLKFHRVISGFMAQGGDPQGNGRGGPAYKYAGEFSPTELHDTPGTLSMANAGPNTDGSQFFITFKATPQLNNRHTVFGRAETDESMTTLKNMEALGRPRDPAPPTEPLFIKKATILIE